ncbi:unnamed protein product [Paramecium sonneborni]|uniref:Uncharacterized protein n=1 Tax=Paramecium sonneborni TaxID=65129 RepID=A0A8S1R858_9CILI|nr:unnamed protein product [Paramecium sonneborni]
MDQCLTLTLSCPFFYENQCYPLSENTCALYQQQQSCQSQYGYCYWNQGQCKLVKKCIHITEQRQCQRFSLSCNWKNNKCESFSCQQIQLENLCKYTIPDLYSDEVQPCIWNNGRCENLIDSNNLDSEQCISNTLDTYKWTGSSCVSCSQTNQLISLYLQLPKQCSCFQLYNQQVCEMTSSCIWLYSSCTYQSCQNINQQINCASNPQCAWISGQCQPFKICNELFGTSQQECILLSVNCPASNGITCQDKKSLKPCSNYQNQSSCANSLGNNGLCFWQNNSCQVLSKCQQITQQQDCQYFSKQCTWTTNCQSIGCSSFNTQATCQYYYSSINSYTPIPCYWNSISGVCAQTTNFMTQLSASTCSINTRLTAQWSYTLNSCLSCQTPNSVNPYQCSCSQIISQINCLQSLQCTWNAQNNQCQQLPCTNLIQSLCIQNSQCMWTGTCQSFSSCTNLIATNSQECQAQSLYCPYYNSNTQKCEVPPLPNPKICLNLTIQECYQIKSCQWNPYEGCQQRNLCNYYSSQIQCVSNPICIWELGCNFKTCNLYISKESCTYTIDLQKQNYIQPCAWINGSCQSTNTVFSEQTCYTNSAFTARWSSNQNDGICIPCNLPIQQQLQPQNQCLCSQLLTEQECNLTECYWENGFCQDFNCYGKSQFNCIQNIQCYWQYSIYDYQNGQCNNIPSLQIVDFCTTLRGKNSLECLAQTKLCPVSLNGICQNRSHLQTCSSMKSLQLCANSVGQEGYCTYKNQQCQVLNNCSQLDNFSECSLFDKICQWNSQTKTCLQIFCSSYTTKDTCTYVFQNINKANIQLCIWNGKSCSSASNCVSCSLNQIKPKHTCSCTLLNDVECTLAKPVCKLIQNNKCVKSECTEIFDSVHCSQQNECMWKNGSCITFTKCSDLNGTTSLDCIAQSLQCQSVSNSQCQPASSLNSCGQYSNQNCKFGILGSDGFCYWNTSTDNCEVISSCDKVMNISICQQLTPACQWSYYFSSCVPFQCQDYLQQEDCTNVVVNLVDPQILLCVWKNQKCEPFVDTYYRFDNSICYVQSDHTYRWVKDDKLGVQCQQCLQAFFINIITIAILNFF